MIDIQLNKNDVSILVCLCEEYGEGMEGIKSLYEKIATAARQVGVEATGLSYYAPDEPENTK